MNDPSTRVRLKRNLRSLCRTFSGIKTKLCAIVMTLMSQLPGMSKSSPSSRSPSAAPWALPRSRSDTNYYILASELDKPRRGSDWTATVNRQLPEVPQGVLRPLQSDRQDGEPLGILHRRQSRAITTSSASPSTQVVKTPREVTRSHSMKAIKKSSELRGRHRGSSIPSEVSSSCSGTKVKQRTISNRSLPLPGDETEYLRLRNFSVTPKGIINRGDSFRSKKSPSDKSSKEPSEPPPVCEPTIVGKVPNPDHPRACKILMVGAADVGKTSLKSQFTTSEYICAYESIQDDDGNNAVTIVLNSEESEMAFEEQILYEESVYLSSDSSNPDAYVIVYSVTNRRSYTQAKLFLTEIGAGIDSKTVILVGNKTDLARLRAVSTEEGRSLAKERGCKFIETSAAINHQVDELLVGILTQIRMKAKVSDKKSKKRETSTRVSSGSKASGVLKKILKRACLKSRSCDNLHVL